MYFLLYYLEAFTESVDFKLINVRLRTNTCTRESLRDFKFTLSIELYWEIVLIAFHDVQSNDLCFTV